jgi:biotin operon repressor
LAERLRVSPRTIRRDIQRLRDLGYPVQAAMGAVGGYRLVAGAAMPPLLLDDEEAVAIAVGLRTAASHAIDGIEEASLQALAKLDQVLPSRLRNRVRALSAATIPLPAWHETPTVDPERLTALAAAVADHQQLRRPCRTRQDPAAQPCQAACRGRAFGRAWSSALQAERRAMWSRSVPGTPFSSTGPISVNVTGPPSAASTTSWLTSTSPGRAYSAILAARFTVRPK